MKYIPGCDKLGWLSAFTDEEKCVGGKVELAASPPPWGTKLYAQEISVLPPIDAVFMSGSPAVGDWLKKNRWERDWAYNDNFRDRSVTRSYESVWQQEYPFYWNNAFATLGGWHMPWPYGDWKDLLDENLLIQTFMDSEPWIEVWQLRSGEFKVIQRMT